MRRWRNSRWFSVGLLLLLASAYLVFQQWGLPLLWPYRDHPLVYVLLDFIFGGHLQDILHEIGTPI